MTCTICFPHVGRIAESKSSNVKAEKPFAKTNTTRASMPVALSVAQTPTLEEAEGETRREHKAKVLGVHANRTFRTFAHVQQ